MLIKLLNEKISSSKFFLKNDENDKFGLMPTLSLFLKFSPELINRSQFLTFQMLFIRKKKIILKSKIIKRVDLIFR